ncbi:thymidylate synthase [Pseudomonas sp. DP-17]|uniref:thymidylate synthase n=1 Tax=Pseudomonas sp. DP-17 TaxID=1580486 RepID=UPI001EFB8815|nr:thymidylate synthase [Pseudomonas sp. DP-17]MCG8911431.1 thymidylate synthase [Pseudomonas sp. DP-17]
MYIKEETLDDLLNNVYSKLLKKKGKVVATKGSFKEITGALLHLKRPRARLSRAEGKGKLFSCLGELAWYLSGSKDLKFITSYIPLYKESSDDRKTVYGGYGPRLVGTGRNNQLHSAIRILSEKNSSRQAVIQLFDAKDILKPHKDIPCTCTLQFLIRNNKLHMFTSMRSNDVYLGLPHDVFAFTMIQEILARSLDCELGEYKHYVSSLHLYERNFESAESYINSGFQQVIEMPEMPVGDPWPSISVLLKAEEKIRSSADFKLNELDIDPYWLDLIRILQFFHLTKSQTNTHLVDPILQSMNSRIYSAYLEKRRMEKLGTTENSPTQLEILLAQAAK